MEEKIHLADYIIKNHKWYDEYVQTNRVDWVRENSWLKIINWGVLIMFIITMIIFQSTMLYTPTMYILFGSVILVWAINYFIFTLSEKHYNKLKKEWWEMYKDDKEFWNSLDYQLLKVNGFI